MIHPHTTVQRINAVIGLGVMATRPIPQGTVVVVPDAFDRRVSRAEFFALPEPLRSALETYAYHDQEGMLHVSWDHAKFMNHSCESNTMLTAYGFELAVADIAAGEELTTEYGLLNVQEPYAISCGCRACRGALRLDDIDRYGEAWDGRIRGALARLPLVDQPLWPLVPAAIGQAIEALQADAATYRPVRTLKWRVAADAGGGSIA